VYHRSLRTILLLSHELARQGDLRLPMATRIHCWFRFSPRGHTHALLDAQVCNERLVDVVGLPLHPPVITMLPQTSDMGRRCKLSTPYEHNNVEVWYSLDGTAPKRDGQQSFKWESRAVPIDDDVTIIKATTYSGIVVPSPLAEVPPGWPFCCYR
jgi:hypothetical protein